MKIYPHVRTLIIIHLLILGIYSCDLAKKESLLDGGFISGNPCEMPCFIGVIPDDTDEISLRKIIEDSKIINYCEEYDFTSSGGTAGYRCTNSSFTLEKGVVTGLEFIPAEAVSVHAVFKKYGEPSAILVVEENLPDYSIQLSARLIYPELCLELYTETKDGSGYNLDSNTLIKRVAYLGKSLCNSLNLEITNQNRWNGYGEYLP